jgi:hypothetical protein
VYAPPCPGHHDPTLCFGVEEPQDKPRTQRGVLMVFGPVMVGASSCAAGDIWKMQVNVSSSLASTDTRDDGHAFQSLQLVHRLVGHPQAGT